MDSSKFNIALIGSGLSAYSALKYLINKNIHLHKAICVVIGDFNKNKSALNDEEFSKLLKSHKLIKDRIPIKEIDYKFLKHAYKSKTNLLSLKSLGGLSKYWGGGFFPIPLNNKNNNIESLIQKEFKFSTSQLSDRFIKSIKSKYQRTYYKPLNCNFLRSSQANQEGKFEILNPGLEIKLLCAKHNIKIFQNTSIETLNIDFENNSVILSGNNQFSLRSDYALVAAGAIGSPEILYKSGIIRNNNINLQDHLLYRVPLLRPIKLIEDLFSRLSNKRINAKSYFSSLRQAFELNIIGRSLFLGLYSLDYSKIETSRILRYLCKSEVLIFSQIYLGNDKGLFSLRFSLNYQKGKTMVTNVKYMSLKEWIYIIRFFLGNFMIPLPYLYRQPFGSSYHIHGSLISELNTINDYQEKSQRIFIIDSSTLNYIGAEPSSFRVINHTLNIMEEISAKFR